ncbi:hypothetical protein EX895_002612 [Sporisorium graminicola]|uniref:Intradiol ring-cleavage dioxygenases domain-containing protein n=1 Tax=Sporisorium graminicola TaxID=280036 RepID=A0A4U7KVL3_9BASI|nr:hypothetical protein EX895_002612 [Sporisorium graminicola]TKY88623.1 hypothetical protein EX895_002612 [Sporisorium graminicola]
MTIKGQADEVLFKPEPPAKADIPTLPIDLNEHTITDIVHQCNARSSDERLKQVMASLVQHLHDFAREINLSESEWMTALLFLTQVGQICSPVRQEFILLSDILGLSALVDSQGKKVPQGATEPTILGPFQTADATEIGLGESIASEGKGEYMYVEGVVKGLDGQPIEGALIETWETDAEGFYDVQYAGRTKADCRGRVRSGPGGIYNFRAVRPVPYPIPSDGPVGKLLQRLGRHVFRPAHLHLQVTAPGYAPLTTALYFEGDDFLCSDAVFGVKTSLVLDLKQIHDPARAKALGFVHYEQPYWLCQYDLTLPTVAEAEQARQAK